MKVVVFGAAGWLGRAILQNFRGRHAVRAFDAGPDAWAAWQDIDGDWTDGETVHGDLTEYGTVDRAIEGMDGIVHAAVYNGPYGPDDTAPFLVNLKGLWNALESARQRGVRRVVHIGSCQTVHPEGVFFSAGVRRPDAGLYAVTKRLQEEMCRQFHDAFKLSIIVLRPDYIVDSRLGIGRARERLGRDGQPYRNGWVCRHDLAEACHLALTTQTVDFDILHIVGTPEADRTCNVSRSRDVLGLVYRGDLEQYK
jgi:nucleoside-diphosphate-sugar epimerase